MLSIAHTVISLPFAFYLEGPLAIFLAAAAFHFFCDTLPHWNVYVESRDRFPYLTVAGDVFGGLVLAWLLLGNDLLSLPVLAAIAGGNAPDVIGSLTDLRRRAGHQIGKWEAQFDSWHDKLQLETTRPLVGLVATVLIMLGAWLLLL